MYIEHVAMYVQDLEAARAFFVKYLNCISGELYHNQKTGFKSYFLSFDSGARLELMHKDNIKDAKVDSYTLGLSHIAFALGSQDAVDNMTKRLKDDGFEVISGPRVTGDGYYESAITIIEGNTIEFTV